MEETESVTPEAVEESERTRLLLVLRVGSLAPFLALGVAYGLSPGFRELLDEGVGLLVRGDLDGLRGWAGNVGPWAPLATTLLMVVQAIAAPIPAVLVTFTNSWLFGPFWGGVVSILEANLAALLCYLLARAWGEPLVARLISQGALDRTRAFLVRHGVAAVLVARLIPIVPFDPVSYVAGLGGMRAWPFFWATLVGQIPAGMAYSYLGQEIARPEKLLLWGACIVAALMVVGWSARRVLIREEGEE